MKFLIVLFYFIMCCFDKSKVNGTPLQLYSNNKEPNIPTEASRTDVDEIIEALNQRIWHPNDISCLNKTIGLLNGLYNNTLWSVWAWESINPAPLGQLFGTRHHLGNFDECMYSPWSNEYPDLQTQYCLIDVILEENGGSIPLNKNSIGPYDTVFDYLHYQEKFARLKDRFMWGLCVPSICQINATLTIADVLLKRTHLYSPEIYINITVDHCQRPDTNVEYDFPTKIFVSFIVFVVAVALLCTYINLRTCANTDTMAIHIIRSFCIVENTKSLGRFTSDGLDLLFGLRFFSVMLIIMGHEIMYYNIGPISNGFKADRVLSTSDATLVLHDDLFVDTFFMLSGLLVMRAFMFVKKIPNIAAAVIKRYIRLAPALVMCIFYMSTALKYTGDGPLWPKYVREDSEPCKQNWWLNILMVSNFIDTNNMCYVNTWYIPCDFQLFLMAVILFWIYSKNNTLGVIAFVATSVISVVIPAAITEYYDFPALPVMSYEVLLNSRKSKHFNIFYMKFYNRAATYLVGLMTGYILSKYKPKDKENRLSMIHATGLAACGVLIMLLDMVYGAYLHTNGWGHLEGILYAALTRPVWGVGLACMIIACAYGYVPLLSPLLTWYPWIPLSKLAFGIYLTHGLLIYRNIFVTRNLNHYDTGNMAIDTWGILLWSTLMAYFMWILVEAPINNLYTIIFVPRHLLGKMFKREITQKDIDELLRGANKTTENISHVTKGKTGDIRL